MPIKTMSTKNRARAKSEIRHSHRQSSNKSISIRNSYEAGASGRRLKYWIPGAPGPNDSILRDLNIIRDRSRDAGRNNAWIKQGIASTVAEEIGTGIRPRSRSTDKSFQEAANALWEKWTKVADADGVLDFYGLQSLASRGRIEAGEMFIRFRVRPPESELPVPLQLQLLEGEFCPVSRNAFASNGRVVRAGIEFDGLGARRAYWMYRNHPGDKFFSQTNLQIVPVPASSIIHHYAPLRPGQIRGFPWTVQSLVRMRGFDEYDDAELVRKKQRAMHSGAITRQDYGEKDYAYDPFTGEPIQHDKADVPITNIEPGTFFNLLPGEDVKFFDGDNTGGGYADFVRQQLLGAAAGLGIPYEVLSGDWGKVNDRLVRVILNIWHRTLEQSQWLLVIPQICQPVWERFIDTAVLSGRLDAPNYETNRDDYLAVEWGPDAWPYVNPLQDVQTDRLRVRSGFTSRTAVAAKRGESAEDIDRENSEDKKRSDSLGLQYEANVESEASEEIPDPGDQPQQ